MGQIAYRANLSAAIYPMTIADGGRTVIIPGPDQNFDRRVDPAGEQKDAGIPQALYLENVMPTANGYQSIGYMTPTSVAMTVPSGASYITQLAEIKARINFIGPVLYPFSLAKQPIFVWNNLTLTTGKFGSNTVTFSGTAPSRIEKISCAVVLDTCYVYISAGGVGELYTAELTGVGDITLTNITATVTPSGFFTGEDIHTICASNNYLIAQSATTTYWSSTTTPTDFVSSLVSGAGSISPNNSDDAILYVKESANGFYLYASNTIIQSQYTGNSRYPFKFTPVRNSTGVYTDNLWGSYGTLTSRGHYVVEKNRYLKFLQGAEAVQVAAEVSDYMGKNTVQEVFNYSTNTFAVETRLTGTPTIYAFLDRYICVSVNGTNESGAADEKYSHVIVFDTVLNRYGRLKLDHTFVFTVSLPNETLAFVNKQTRQISFLTFDIYQNSEPFAGVTYQTAQGVLVLGKFQYVRSRKIQINEIEIEGPQNTSITPVPNFACILLPAQDGRTFDAPVTPALRFNSGGLAVYNAHATAQNHSIAIKGAFNVNTLQLRFTPRGER
jgi:hypothetical protein